MGIRIAKRCLVSENGVQCLAEAGHKAGECVFVDGTAAMEKAEKKTKLTVATEGDLAAIGVVVLPIKDVDGMSMLKKLAANVIIGYDGQNIRVFKSKHVQCPADGIEPLAMALRAPRNGGDVRFGVGSVTIVGPEA